MLREIDRLGSDEDFDGFYRAQYTRLVRALLLLTGDANDAEDLAQEALARVFERWERVARMESPEGYLYRTAFNLRRKETRRLRVRTRRASDPSLSTRPDPSLDDRLTVLSAVASLPAAQREALVLVEWLGFEVKDAAAVLGIRPVSVRSRLLDARRGLRKRLGGSDG